ncbi:MAG: NAD-dependent epimerase/dehydratase family protein, partial [Gemmatimonadales bacterium]
AEPAPHREADTPRPGNAYERSKLAAEHVLAAALAGSPVSWTILRPQGLYGADRPATATQFREIAHRRLWVHGPARVAVHPTHVADLVAVVARVLGREDLDGEVINVGGERSLEFSDLIALIGRCIGHAPLQFRAPRWTGHAARIAAHGWSAVGTPPNALTRQARSWINRAVDIDKARRLLGFQPVPLEWGIDQTARALLQNGNL